MSDGWEDETSFLAFQVLLQFIDTDVCLIIFGI